MSAIVAVAGRAGGPEEQVLLGMLEPMRSRGTEEISTWRSGPAGLGTGRYAWELDPAHSGAVGVLQEGDQVVAADATLYHRSDLRRRLREAGIEAGPTSSHLILAAFRAWGPAAFRVLEGDFAFVVYDQSSRRVYGARDFVGTRLLHYATVCDRIVVASTVGGVRAFPGCSDDLNLVAVAEVASMLLAATHETSYRAIRSLPAGHMFTYEVDSGRLAVERIWSAPRFAADLEPKITFDEAAGELRRLLEQAVGERMPTAGPATVTLSGGWDSPTVYAVAQAVSRATGRGADAVHAVSMSFPPGDSGRENEMIQDITGHFGRSPRWLEIHDMPLFYEGFLESAAERDDPLVHPYLPTNRAMVAAGREVDSRVCFNGYGGDNLFHGEISYLSDLLVRGRIREFRRQWKREGLSGFTIFRRHVLLPLLGHRSRSLLGLLRGRPLPATGHLERVLAPWIRPEYAENMLARDREFAPKRTFGEPLESFEHRWILEHPMFARMAAWIQSISLQEGMEQRSPLIDARVVAFAATRPRWERRSDRTTKRLMRASVSDLLPAHVLADRRSRTGTLTDYWSRSMFRDLPRLAAPLFDDPVLGQLGIVDVEALRKAVRTLRPDRIRTTDAALLMTLQTEAWLRYRAGMPVPGGEGATAAATV